MSESATRNKVKGVKRGGKKREKRWKRENRKEGKKEECQSRRGEDERGSTLKKNYEGKMGGAREVGE